MKKYMCLLLVINLFGMEEDTHKHKHYSKPRSGSQEFVTINILPDKTTKSELADKKEERRAKLKIAAIAAASAIISAGLTAAVTLTIHFTECEQ